MTAERNYSAELPTEPPDGLIPWLLQRGALKNELLIYKMGSWYNPLTERHEKAVKLACTACGGVVYTTRVEGPECASYASATFGFLHPTTNEPLISGKSCECPECGAHTRVYHSGCIRNGEEFDACHPLTVARIGDKFAIIGWCIQKKCDKDAAARYESHGYEAYIVEPKNIVRLKAYNRCMNTFSFGHWQQMKNYYDSYGETDLIYPFDPSILIGSTAENSKLDMFVRNADKNSVYPITYLQLWQKHPQAENLVTQGASFLLNAVIDENKESGGISGVLKSGIINWKEKQPSKMLGLTKDELRTFVKGKWGLETLTIFQEEKKLGRALAPTDIKETRGIGLADYRAIRERGVDFMKTVRYLKRQKAKDRRADMNILRDYWRIAEMTGHDMASPAILLPPRLMSAHDRVEQVRKWQDDAKKAAEREARAARFTELYGELSAYSWEHDGLLIRPVRDELELLAEGERLIHCVGSYAKVHIKGERPIFVMRRADKPDEPWYTLQLNAKDLTVVQNRGLRNCARTKKVTAFESQWLAHIRELGAATAPKKRRRAPKAAAAA